MNAEQIFSRLHECSIPAEIEACRKLMIFHSLLLEWNEKMDLTAVTDDDEILDRHYVDSLMLLTRRELMPANGSEVIDVGTGAGFPGMILAIFCPHVRFTLMDSQQKRLNFLAAAAESMKLENVKIVHSRAEDGAKLLHQREKFDMAVARAVAPMNVLCEYLLPYVKTGGKVVCWKGPSGAQECEESTRAAEILGGKISGTVPYIIPGRDWSHVFVTVEKIRKTPAMYPRKAGTPGKNPIK